MEESYKLQHESFVSGSKGTTAIEIIFLSLLTPIWNLTVATFTCALRTFLADNHYWTYGILETFLLCFPLISAVTFLNNYIPALLMMVIMSSAFCALFLKYGNCNISTGKYQRPPVSSTEFISYYRSQLFLDTSISILAVDFPVYPRRLAKTELYGFGYMDVGVGCFIFAAGIVSYEARASGKFSRWNLMKASLKSNSLMVFLGLIRAISVWATNYHVQVSEYGVHWNFFLTLAAVRIICSCMLSIFSLSKLTVFVGSGCLFYQWMLIHGKLSDFILDEQREGLFEQNKEGLLSLVGYCFLYLAAALIGKIVFSSETRRRLVWKLFAFGFISFFMMACTHCIVQPTSRRLLNISYILWMVFFNCFHLALFVLRDTMFPQELRTLLLLAINRNAIVHFLLANLLTGAINFTLDTIHASNFVSVIVIVLYTVCLSSVVLYLHKYNLKVDFLGLKIKKS